MFVLWSYDHQTLQIQVQHRWQQNLGAKDVLPLHQLIESFSTETAPLAQPVHADQDAPSSVVPFAPILRTSL